MSDKLVERRLTKRHILSYSTSLEKWQSIRKFAEINGMATDNIDAMIAKIKSVGDVSIPMHIRYLMIDGICYSYVITNGSSHPCPHCVVYKHCKDCPLFDGIDGLCCKEWVVCRDDANDARNVLYFDV